MSREGRQNTAKLLKEGVDVIGVVADDYKKAVQDGHVEKHEAIGIFLHAITHVLRGVLQIAVSRANEKTD